MGDIETTTAPTAPVQVEIPDYLQRLLVRIAAREGFTDYTIVSEPGSNIGDGFQGLMLSIVIAGSRDEAANEKLVLICKVPPKSDFRRQMAVNAFKQEIYAYDKILPEIERFQREKGLTKDDGFFSFPRCYGTHSDEERFEFAIALEDLRHSGYRMWNKYQPIDFSHVRLAVTELGKFHAVSFALRKQKPDLFEKFMKLPASIIKTISDFPPTQEFFKTAYDQAIAVLPEGDTSERQRIQYIKDNLVKVINQVATGNLAEPYSVLCHGDFWNNNMMFHYASDDSLVPQSVCLIDWQMGQYCSPVTDLFYYLYSSTEQPLRTAHFDDILHAYHNNLAVMLRRLGGDAKTQFPYDAFEEQLHKFGWYGMVMAPLLVQVVTVKTEDLPDMDALTLDNPGDFQFMKNGNAAGYEVRMRDVIRDFVRRGYFGEELMNDG